ncbi:MAG: hypothetical protein R3B48_29805 [Kofleriaceae bacterium]
MSLQLRLRSLLPCLALVAATPGCLTYTSFVLSDNDPETKFKVGYFALATAGESVAAAGGVIAQTTGSRDEKIFASIATTISIDVLFAVALLLVNQGDL